MNGPLSGITVIDQTQALAGPYCSMILGDLGAEVIKLERPGVGDQSRSWGPPFIGDESAYYLAVNRNKRSMTLNIAHPDGQAILHKMVDQADIFLTNLPALSKLEQYHIDYETLKQRNQGIIYGAISGYGHSGPRAGQAGYDLAAQGESGTMYLAGDPSGAPARFPTPIADMTAGMFTVIGILAALHARHQSGVGQFIDVSLLESQTTWLENYAGEYFATNTEPPRRGNVHPQVSPYEPVMGSDSVWFILGVGSDNIWRKFCNLVGLDDLQADPRFATNADRVRNREALMPLVQAVMSTSTAAHWLALFMLKSLATPIHLSQNGITFRHHAPMLGEQTDEILAEFGYDGEMISTLRADSVI